MRYAFKLRGKEVVVSTLEGVTAVRPREDDGAVTSSTRGLARRFGGPAEDDSAGSVGLVLPAHNRKLFEQAGWVFVEPDRAVAKAAMTRVAVEGADAVRQVYLGRSGTLLGTDRVTVQFESPLTDAEAREQLAIDGLKLTRALKLGKRTFEAKIMSQRPELEVVQELQESSRNYSFVEPVFLEVLTGRRTPTDPGYGNQWQHSNDGSNGGVAGADIHSEAAWDVTRGARVRLAVIDNGMRVKHPDLMRGIVGGGYFSSDGMGGAVFTRWQPGQTGFPRGNHGTFCLGMAGARMDNKKGGCGSAPEADLLAIACMGDQVGTQLTLARAIAYAANPSLEDASADANAGADVISCSLGPNSPAWDMTSVLELAITGAATNGRAGKGVPILWAATNTNDDIGLDEVCSHPDVLAVSRSNRNDLEDNAAFGDKLEFVAPGVEVYSTTSRGYGFDTGCSYAAPLAAGVAALVLAKNPQWTCNQVRQRLRDCCDQVGVVPYSNGRNRLYGFGRINAEKAVQ